MISLAKVSDCGLFRYNLVRILRPDVGDTWCGWKRVLYVGANPSTADGAKEDNTSRRGIGFTTGLKVFSSFEIVNPFAFRATEPDDLMERLAAGEDGVGPENDAYILAAARRASLVICAWGCALRTKHPVVRKRLDHVIALLHTVHKKLYALDRTKGGEPRHLLMLPSTCSPTLWREVA